MVQMSRGVLRPALVATLAAALAVLAACAGRPSPEDYAAYEAMLHAKGKLRTETVAADAPFDAADLARNYARIALAREADPTRPGGDDNLSPSPLRRWQGPLRYRLSGGAVTAADRAEVAALMGRVARLTGLDIAEASGQDTNFLILVTVPEERERVAAGLAESTPRFAETFGFWRRHSSLICVADNLVAREAPHGIVAAMVVIGAETQGLLRRACLHEEIVQSLGLANDHPEVRPSIFNDDGEFALLTGHDALLLRLHYDPRLTPGMTAEEAMPTVRRIARELMREDAAPVTAAMSGVPGAPGSVP